MSVVFEARYRQLLITAHGVANPSVSTTATAFVT